MNETLVSVRHSRNPRPVGRVLATALSTVTLVVGLTGGVLAQSPAPPAVALPSPAADALKVVTTTTVFADIVRNIAREHAQVVFILPAGVGPEDYEPKPGDAQLLADADLIVSNGVGLDDFLQRLLQSGTGGQTAQLVLGDGIPTVSVDGKENPHFWLDPGLVAQYYVPEIIGALSAIDPSHGADYGMSGSEYASRITALDLQLQAIVDTIPEANRKLVTFHDAFPYLARHFGFELVGVILDNVGAEPTAADLATLIRRVQSAGVKGVFSELQFNPALIQTVADEAGVSHVVTDLYTDALGPSPADTYLGLMRYDIEQIANALR